MSYEVEYYEKADGTRPAEDFILEQDNKMQAKIFSVLTYLEARGSELREPYSKSLGDGIFEIRVKVAPNVARVLYFFVAKKKVILTNGFIKKTPKTPPNEMNRAKQYRADYHRQQGGAIDG